MDIFEFLDLNKILLIVFFLVFAGTIYYINRNIQALRVDLKELENNKPVVDNTEVLNLIATNKDEILKMNKKYDTIVVFLQKFQQRQQQQQQADDITISDA
jgi:hypothetical protein